MSKPHLDFTYGPVKLAKVALYYFPLHMFVPGIRVSVWMQYMLSNMRCSFVNAAHNLDNNPGEKLPSALLDWSVMDYMQADGMLNVNPCFALLW